MLTSLREAVAMHKRRPALLIVGVTIWLGLLISMASAVLLGDVLTPSKLPLLQTRLGEYWQVYAWIPLVPIFHAIILPLALSGSYSLIEQTGKDEVAADWNNWRDYCTAMTTFLHGVRSSYSDLLVGSLLRLGLAVVGSLLVAGGLLGVFSLIQMLGYAWVTGDEHVLFEAATIRRVALFSVGVGAVAGTLPWTFYDVAVVMDGKSPVDGCLSSFAFASQRPGLLMGYVAVVGLLSVPGVVVGVRFHELQSAYLFPLWFLTRPGTDRLVLLFLLAAVFRSVAGALHPIFYYRRIRHPTTQSPGDSAGNQPSLLTISRLQLRQVKILIVILLVLTVGGTTLRLTDIRPADPQPTFETEGVDAGEMVTNGKLALEHVNYRSSAKAYEIDSDTGRQRLKSSSCVFSDHRNRQYLTTFYRVGGISWHKISIYASPSEKGFSNATLNVNSPGVCPETTDWGIGPAPKLHHYKSGEFEPQEGSWEVSQRNEETIVVTPTTRKELRNRLESKFIRISSNSSDQHYRIYPSSTVEVHINRSTGYLSHERFVANYTVHDPSNGTVVRRNTTLVKIRYWAYGEDTVDRPTPNRTQGLWLEPIYNFLDY